jgi:O-antigen ligase
LAAWAALFVVLLIERATGGYFLGLERVNESELRHFDTLSPGLAFLTCLTFPVAYLAWKTYARLWAPFAVVLACFALGVAYRMDAAPFGLIVGGIAFLCVRVAGRVGFAAVAGALALVALVWGPLATLAWSNDLPTWFTQHFTHNWGLRVEIWHHADELIRARPVLGYGFDATRIVGQPYDIPIHTHNGLLQVWLELGVVGVALFLGWSALALLALYRRAADRAALATALATVLTVSVFWEVSFGIWQGWWLATLGLTFIALRIALRA